MTRNKLLELYEKLKELNLDVYALKELMNYTDEEIEAILKSENIDTIISIIQNNKFNLLNLEQRKQVIEAASKASTRRIVGNIYDIILTEQIISSGKAAELAQILCESKGSSQSHCALSAAKELRVLLHPDCLELIRCISQTKNRISADSMLCTVTNETLLSRENALQLIELASKSDEEYKTGDIHSIICDEYLLEANKVEDYIKRILNANNRDEAFKIYSEAMNESERLEKEKKANENIQDSFWYLFSVASPSPDEAIKELKANTNENEEIKPYTRVRRKRPTDN